ncbi:MAG: serine/threonine protein kinase [Lentisphaeria bacterium]|nr:serine/threonine protein kinase [Lentisphaeria bacterium]
MHEFENFSPESFLPFVGESLQCRMTGLAAALPSYINRVFLTQAGSGDRLVLKFYRPNRWTPDAIRDEHDFLWDCDAEGIPVVPPFELANGDTLAFADDIPFAVFPLKRGRNAEIDSEGFFQRAGALLGRIHDCGLKRIARHRMTLSPENFAFRTMERLFESGAVHPRYEEELMTICEELINLAEDCFPDPESFFRIHGDFHIGNLLERPGEGLTAIDFDDMLNGPAVQNVWMLLPGAACDSIPQLQEFLSGYRMFLDFPVGDLRIVELLRALRMMHYLSWCAIQRGDRKFQELYPDWGTEIFWRKELEDFRRQRVVALQTLEMPLPF